MEQNSEPRNSNSHTYSEFTFNKGAKNVQWQKKTISSINAAGKTGYPCAEE